MRRSVWQSDGCPANNQVLARATPFHPPPNNDRCRPAAACPLAAIHPLSEKRSGNRRLELPIRRSLMRGQSNGLPAAPWDRQDFASAKARIEVGACLSVGRKVESTPNRNHHPNHGELVTLSIAAASVSMMHSSSSMEIASGGMTYKTSANGRNQTPRRRVSRHTRQARRFAGG